MGESPWRLYAVPDRFKTKRMYEKVVEDEPEALEFVLDHFKTEKMCEKAVEAVDPYTLEFVPDLLKTQEMCNKAVCIEPTSLVNIPDHFKTEKICDKAVKDGSSSLQFVPNWFITGEWVDMWYDDYYDDSGGYWDDDDDNKDKFLEWYDGYKKRKVQKASIKEELLPIAWHPSRY